MTHFMKEKVTFYFISQTYDIDLFLFYVHIFSVFFHLIKWDLLEKKVWKKTLTGSETCHFRLVIKH